MVYKRTGISYSMVYRRTGISPISTESPSMRANVRYRCGVLMVEGVKNEKKVS